MCHFGIIWAYYYSDDDGWHGSCVRVCVCVCASVCILSFSYILMPKTIFTSQLICIQKYSRHLELTTASFRFSFFPALNTQYYTHTRTTKIPIATIKHSRLTQAMNEHTHCNLLTTISHSIRAYICHQKAYNI